MKIGYRSCVGKRGVNQDSIAVLRSEAVYESREVGAALLVVADGVGGHNAGGVASRLATMEVAENMGRLLFEKDIRDISPEMVAARFQEIIKHVNRDIFDRSKRVPEYQGMGTTLTVAIVFDSAVYIGHVGDSRAYIINTDKIKQITRDHSLMQEKIDEGKITKKEARRHPERGTIMRVVGFFEDIEVDTSIEYIFGDEYLLLCSDGLTDVVSDEEIHRMVKENDNLQKICDELVNKAIDRNATSISVIVAQFDELKRRTHAESDKTEAGPGHRRNNQECMRRRLHG